VGAYLFVNHVLLLLNESAVAVVCL